MLEDEAGGTGAAEINTFIIAFVQGKEWGARAGWLSAAPCRSSGCSLPCCSWGGHCSGLLGEVQPSLQPSSCGFVSLAGGEQGSGGSGTCSLARAGCEGVCRGWMSSFPAGAHAARP